MGRGPNRPKPPPATREAILPRQIADALDPCWEPILKAYLAQAARTGEFDLKGCCRAIYLQGAADGHYAHEMLADCAPGAIPVQSTGFTPPDVSKNAD